jgi:hypothetical protein
MIEPLTMEQIIESSPAVFLRRYPSYLIGSFAALALGPALIGLCGVISFSVASVRGRLPFAWRSAPAARGAEDCRGVAGGLRLSRKPTLRRPPTDPVTFAALSVLLIAVALVASDVPRRAAQVDPIVALRHE